MTELLTAAQMSAIETAAIESGAVTGLDLMERAGRGVVEAMFEEWPDLIRTPQRAVVLCGPGNNGGDGFVVARLLTEWGWDVDLLLYGDPEKLPPDARTNYERWATLGHTKDMSTPGALSDLTRPDILVDGLFGTGLGRPVEGDLAQVLQDVNSLREGVGTKVVAIDLPSGLCSDSGKHLGAFATADLTVSFHRAKLGHYLDRGPARCGRVVVKSIGLEHGEHGSGTPRPAKHAPVTLAAAEAHHLAKKADAHKYAHGHALILSGGAGTTGAARLSALGALRVGAGLVTVGVPPSAQMEVACQITALMLKRVEDGEALREVLGDDRINALALGPGLGLDRARALVPAALGAEHTPSVVLDADALTAYTEEPEGLFGMLHEACVLTPHAGEFARLFPDIARKLNAAPTKGPAYSKLDATSDAAQRAGCVVLFKGPDTVIAAPDGRCCINSAQYDRAAPWLATAGSGDVLAGFITGLLARGLDPMPAAETAAWLHVECARSFGPGLIAEDLPEELPKVFGALGLA